MTAKRKAAPLRPRRVTVKSYVGVRWKKNPRGTGGRFTIPRATSAWATAAPRVRRNPVRRLGRGPLSRREVETKWRTMAAVRGHDITAATPVGAPACRYCGATLAVAASSPCPSVFAE